MKYIKQTVLILLMAIIAISCSDDSIVETDDGDGELNPNTKVVITAEIDGDVVSTNTFELKDDSYIPSTSATTGSYNELSKMFSINISDRDGSLPKFNLGFTSMIQDFKVGTYSYTSESSDFLAGSYMNKELNENAYMASSVEMNITDMKYLGISTAGAYYTTGEFTMVGELNGETVTVKAIFDNIPIAYVGNISAKE